MNNLFSEYRIKNINIKNRIVLPPLVRFSIVGEDGYVTEELIQWYRETVQGGTGLIIVEATCVSKDAKLRKNQLGIWDDTFIPGLSKIAEMCNEYKVPCLLQIHHAGFGENVSDVSEGELDRILELFHDGVIRAKKAGFQGVEIHGAHTYLISQLHSKVWNKREDKYGITAENPIPFSRDLIRRISYLLDYNFILGYRIGGNEPTLSDGIEIARALEKEGADLLHVSSGVPDPNIKGEEKILKPKEFPLDWVVYMGTEIKKHVNIPVIGVRRIKEEADASWLIENNLLDFVAVGRAMISRPDWAKWAEQQYIKRNSKKSLDIFCKVVDNFGDIGVAYRLANIMKKNYNVRVFVDSLKELAMLNPACSEEKFYQRIDGVEYILQNCIGNDSLRISPANIIIEAFGCDIDEMYINRAKNESDILINLEYLSSEEWTEDFHGVESYMGNCKLKKYFFIPGLNEKTGGVLFNKERVLQLSNLDENTREKKLSKYLPKELKEKSESTIVGTIFSYEKDFTELVKGMENSNKDFIIFLMGDKTKNSFKNMGIYSENDENKVVRHKNINFIFYRFLPQDQYDELINLCDFNFVRGEDSFVRAAVSKRSFFWNIYVQEDEIHLEKLNGFLRTYSQYFQNNFNSYGEYIEIYKKLLMSYNKEHSELNYLKEWEFYFENIDIYTYLQGEFSDYVVKNLDLVDKLDRFICKKVL